VLYKERVLERAQVGMALTKAQKRLYAEADKIAKLTMVDFWNIGRQPGKSRRAFLQVAIHQMVVAEVVTRYTLLDEILSQLICVYYFGRRKKSWKLWKRQNYRVFVHFILDEMYLLKKMAFVHEVEPLPKGVRSILHKVNSLRNVVAHSFFPENRKEYRDIGKVLYDGRDIRTSDGMAKFIQDSGDAFDYLEALI
jgi:hypothetical protein